MHRSPFEDLPDVEPDPILALVAEAKAARSAGRTVVNGTIGEIANPDDDTMPAVFSSVLKAYDEVTASYRRRGFPYSPSRGTKEYLDVVGNLLPFDKDRTSLSATVGGTGALSAIAKLMTMLRGNKEIVVPDPPWANHRTICELAGMHVRSVPYLEGPIPTIEHILKEIRNGVQSALLQVVCHNPTGKDLSDDQWKILAQEMAKHGTIALLDFAYQGLGDKPENDAKPLTIMQNAGVPTLVAWSASKNHSIYDLRMGAAAGFAPDAKTGAKMNAQLGRIVRGTYSMSSSMSQAIVTHVQKLLKDEWLENLRTMRQRLGDARLKLIRTLPEKCKEWLQGRGMFTHLPLSPEEQQALKSLDVYMVGRRMNIGSLIDTNIDLYSEKLLRVIGEERSS